MTDKYAVIGNPIAHSKSPLIHEAFAKQTGQDISYERILAPLDGFEATVRDLIIQGYKGVNITVPFKIIAYKLYPTYSPQAHLAGAVNTLVFANDGHGNVEVIPHNTDGIGLVEDITVNLNHTIRSKRVLLLGAGGAAEGVYQPLLVNKPEVLIVANRTLENAQRVVNLSNDKAWHGIASNFEDLAGQQFDIIINATSTGLTDTALPIPNTIFAKGCLAYDMMYGRETPFMKQARENGAQVADGLGMLVEQAAEAFYIWRGVRPETQSVMQQIRQLA
jgi:shikimate dehydrogenase